MGINMKRTYFGIILLSVIILSCSKYDDGPNLSLYSKGARVAGNWYFDRVLFGDADSTDNYRYGMMEILLSPEKPKNWGIFSWNPDMSKPFDPARIQAGQWNFNEEKDSLVFQIFTSKDSTVWHWRIERLAYTEMWLERSEKDYKVKWRLWKRIY